MSSYVTNRTPALPPTATRAWLASARRPLIIAGGGARAAADALRRLAEAVDGFVVTTAAGKGLLPERHPANLGASLPYRKTQDLIAAADIVLAVGTELSEGDVYTTTRLAITGRLIRVDVDATKLSDHYGADLALWGDARTSLEAIAAGTAARSGWRTEAGTAGTHRLQIEQRFGAATQACAAALQAIRASLPADSSVFTDMTQIAYLGNYAYPADRPGVWFHPSGYGTLGYALPAAVGARLARPSAPSLRWRATSACSSRCRN